MDEPSGPGDGLLYTLLGALCLVVVGGGLYVHQNSGNLLPSTGGAVELAAPSARQLSQTRSVIADARRLALRGDFGAAENALQAADRILPGFSETSVARREIAEMRTTRGEGWRDRVDRHQEINRIAALVDTAHAAIARRDYAAANRALDEAERIDSRDPAVVRTRNELAEAANRPAGRD